MHDALTGKYVLTFVFVICQRGVMLKDANSAYNANDDH